jgi:two-component system, LytTR family, sensor kinase
MKKSAVIFLHLGYWVLYIILVSFFIQVMPNTHHHFIKILFFSQVSFFAFLPGLLCFYIFYLILFPGFLSRKKFLSLFFTAITVSLFCGLLTLIIIAVLFNMKWYSLETNSIIGIITFISLLGLVHGIIGLVMCGFITWFGDIKLKEELNKKNYEVELALVKSQINPHFLFNTINNIDVLIEKDAVKASVYLNKLSDIMRFMLYETKSDHIKLSKELVYIEKYIELQKIRSSNPDYVNYIVEGDVKNVMIAPMLFIPFIENAFKHAENKKKENAVNIKFSIEENTIHFYCENKFINNSTIKPDHSGLGNELIKRRLQLLYPGKYQLVVINENETYIIKLMLIINEN